MNNINYVLRPIETSKALGVCTETLRLWRKKGLLPPPIKLGERSVGWLKSDIEKFIETRIAERG